MIDELTRKNLPRLEREALRRRLTLAPWCWPPEENRFAWERAVDVAGGIPALPVGSAPLLTVSPTAVTLWVLHRCHRRPALHGARVLGAEAERQWLDAATALPNVLPILWSSVLEARDTELSAFEVISKIRGGSAGVACLPAAIEGRSFGVSFLLALASKVLGQELPADLVASAAIDSHGRVSPVDEIRDKVSLVLQRAPRIECFLVHSDNEKEATTAALGSRLRIVPIETGIEAIEAAFGNDLREKLVALGNNANRRAELVEAFFRLALSGRSQVIDWTPVEQAAALALDAWCDLDADQQQRLEFARAVASRNERNDGDLKMPDGAWRARLPAPIRIRVLANLAEQAAETGSPEPAEVEAAAAEYLEVTQHEAFIPHLELRAAVGRLLSVTGRLESALRQVHQSTAGLVERDAFQVATRPLADMFRIAGLLSEPEAFAAAEELRDDIRAHVALEWSESSHVDLSRARAMILLGRVPEDIEGILRKLASRHEGCAQLRYSAVRWLVRVLDDPGRGDEGDRLLSELDEKGTQFRRDAETARTFAALIRLDRSLRSGDRDGADKALQALEREDPGLVRNLRRTAADGAALARLYPD